MENGNIPGSNIKAMSQFQTRKAPKARLNGPSHWGTRGSTIEPWIQADIGYQTDVIGVITQGSNETNWIETMKVSTFKMTIDDVEVFVKDQNGNVKVIIQLSKNLHISKPPKSKPIKTCV